MKQNIQTTESANPQGSITEFIIRSNERGTYFVAIHGNTPFYGSMDKAKVFTNFDVAVQFARKELFTSDGAFAVIDLWPDKH